MSMETDTMRESQNQKDGATLSENVVQLNSFRTKKSLAGDRKSGLQDSFQLASAKDSNSSTTTTKSAESITPEKDLADRIERLKSSINRINALLEELRSVPDKKLKE